MPRLTTLWQSIKIEYISVAQLEDGILKIGGKVLSSNFLEEGRRSLMPVFAEKTADILSVGDILKVTLYTPKGESEESHDGEARTLMFKDCGTKYELWNDEAQGWDKIFEIFRDND